MCLYYLRMSCLYPHKSFIYINKATILAFSGCFYRRIFCCHQGVVVKLVFKIFYYVWNLSFKFSVNLCLVCLLTLLFIDSFIPLNPFAYILFLIFIYYSSIFVSPFYLHVTVWAVRQTVQTNCWGHPLSHPPS